MNSVPFARGPYDGAIFTFCERLPDRVDLAVDCVGGDPGDPKLQEVLRFNLGNEVDGIMIVRTPNR